MPKFEAPKVTKVGVAPYARDNATSNQKSIKPEKPREVEEGEVKKGFKKPKKDQAKGVNPTLGASTVADDDAFARVVPAVPANGTKTSLSARGPALATRTESTKKDAKEFPTDAITEATRYNANGVRSPAPVGDADRVFGLVNERIAKPTRKTMGTASPAGLTTALASVASATLPTATAVSNKAAIPAPITAASRASVAVKRDAVKSNKEDAREAAARDALPTAADAVSAAALDALPIKGARVTAPAAAVAPVPVKNGVTKTTQAKASKPAARVTLPVTANAVSGAALDGRPVEGAPHPAATAGAAAAAVPVEDRAVKSSKRNAGDAAAGATLPAATNAVPGVAMDGLPAAAVSAAVKGRVAKSSKVVPRPAAAAAVAAVPIPVKKGAARTVTNDAPPPQQPLQATPTPLIVSAKEGRASRPRDANAASGAASADYEQRQAGAKTNGAKKNGATTNGAATNGATTNGATTNRVTTSDETTSTRAAGYDQRQAGARTNDENAGARAAHGHADQPAPIASAAAHPHTHSNAPMPRAGVPVPTPRKLLLPFQLVSFACAIKLAWMTKERSGRMTVQASKDALEVVEGLLSFVGSYNMRSDEMISVQKTFKHIQAGTDKRVDAVALRKAIQGLQSEWRAIL